MKLKRSASLRLTTMFLAVILVVGVLSTGFLSTMTAYAADDDWDISKSKSATNLYEDENGDLRSTVTLSLPADTYEPDIDILFVMDGSTSSDNEPLVEEAAELIEDLSRLDNVNVRAGLVVFGGSVKTLYSTEGLLDLSVDENARQLMKDIVTNYRSYEGRSGTNLQAGIEEGRRILNDDNEVESSDKYMILLTDAGCRMFLNEDGECVSETYYSGTSGTLSSSNVQWNTNEDWLARYGTYMPGDGAFEVPTFADTWADGQSGAQISKYAMTESEKNEAIENNDSSGMATTDIVKNSTDYYSVYEASAYYAATSMIEGAGEETILYVSYPYYPPDNPSDPQYTYNYYINSFQEWLGETCVTRYEYDGTQETAEEIFSEIANEVIELDGAGSVLIDEMGDCDAYDFDFVDDINCLSLTVDGEALDVTALTPEKGEQSAYGFGDANGSEDGTTYPFILRYYPDGYTYSYHNSDEGLDYDDTYGECFVLEINITLTKDHHVSLIYDVILTNPETHGGIYGEYDSYGENNDGSSDYDLYTNNIAVLCPTDSEGNHRSKQAFAMPTVSYTVIEATKEWKDEENRDGIRPESITVELLEDGTATGQTVVLSEDNNWNGYFIKPYTNPDGSVVYSYSIQETEVEGYTGEISGDLKTGYVITNTHKPEEKTTGNPGPTSTPNPGNPEPTSTPNPGTVKTGDTNNIGLWITLMLISAATFITGYWKLHKRA